MVGLVEARLTNPAFGDPGLVLDVRFGRQAVLFDIGDIRALPTRILLRVDTVCVSHRHMDHFSGLDDLLRLRLNRPGVLRMFGPAGFVDGVAARLGAYTWNLLGPRSADFRILASSIDDTGETERALFAAREGFRRRDRPADLPPGLLMDGPDMRIETTVLDHGTPVLAFALQESRSVHVMPERLADLGLAVGPWLGAAKRLVRGEAADDTPVDVGGGTIPLGLLRDRAFRIDRGQRIAYVTDVAFTDENARRIRAIAAGADQLFIEAVFLDEDRALAVARKHLTAGDAGRLAAEAGVRRVTPFHFSPRYETREQDLIDEVQATFAAGTAAMVALVAG
ncbi:ribonuclease Z [Chthonobacter rhizosphaerae]|uniref:ribonuclease Z n=1 Tax=Chthonobacter rhizosphaerae TaxID=2735553 RepID=UPI0015EED73C|nr:MBL fold metallo-hydrolase [Chthonobacter rhizosphaerae]